MSNLTLKGIPEGLHQRLRDVAEVNRRSLNGEVIHRLERSFETRAGVGTVMERNTVAYAGATATGQPEARGLTLAEFIALPEEDPFRVELVAGQLIREPAPGFRHGRIATRLYRRVWEAAGPEGQGEVFFDMGFLLARDPPTVRIPDLAFVSASRLAESETDETFLAIAPDLAVEVLSPSNAASAIQRKALECLDAGGRLVWVVDPVEETVTVYRARDDIQILGAEDSLDATAVVPGLEVEVGTLFG